MRPIWAGSNILDDGLICLPSRALKAYKSGRDDWSLVRGESAERASSSSSLLYSVSLPSIHEWERCNECADVPAPREFVWVCSVSRRCAFVSAGCRGWRRRSARAISCGDGMHLTAGDRTHRLPQILLVACSELPSQGCSLSSCNLDLLRGTSEAERIAPARLGRDSAIRALHEARTRGEQARRRGRRYLHPPRLLRRATASA